MGLYYCSKKQLFLKDVRSALGKTQGVGALRIRTRKTITLFINRLLCAASSCFSFMTILSFLRLSEVIQIVRGRDRCGPRVYRLQSLGSFYCTLMSPMESRKG